MGHLISSNKYILIGCHAKIAGENVDWCVTIGRTFQCLHPIPVEDSP